jgi:DNA-binding MarR family transcriptional regulator
MQPDKNENKQSPKNEIELENNISYLFQAHNFDLKLRSAELMLRRVRDKYFPEGYFASSMWDILIEIDCAARQGQKYSASEVGLDAKIPLTTALRYLAILESDGMILRTNDPANRRRTFVSLTMKGRSALDESFNETMRLMEKQHNSQAQSG